MNERADSAVPPGLDAQANPYPALKRRAIFITSLRDFASRLANTHIQAPFNPPSAFPSIDTRRPAVMLVL